MAIYRTILEEELELAGVLDDNKEGMCPEIEEIEKIVADQDANAFEQDEAQAAEFGPSEGVDDILDESFIAIAEAEMNFNKMMMAIGVYELTEAAAGKEVTYTEADKDSFIDRAKQWVVNFFKKIWAALQRYAANLADIFRTNKAFLAKYKDSDIQAGYEAYKKANADGTDMYPYENLIKILKGSEKTDKWMGDVNATIGMDKYFVAGGEFNSGTDKLDKEDTDKILREYRKAICGVECSAGEFRAKLHDYLCGEKKKAGLMEPADVLYALGCSDAVKACRSAMDSAKKEYKDAIKKLDTLKRRLPKADNDVVKRAQDDMMEAAVSVSKMLREVLSASQVTRSSLLSAAHGFMNQGRSFALRYIAAGRKPVKEEKKGAKNESTQYGFLSNLELI